MEEASQSTRIGSVRVLAINELLDICPMVDVCHKRINLGEGYMNGGAQICVITQACMEKMELEFASLSRFFIQLASH